MNREANRSLDGELDPQGWELVIQIFDAALEMPESERDDFLRNASHGDSKIYFAVRRLVEGHGRAGDFLDTPARPDGIFEHFASTSPPFQPGQTIANRFRILRLVGEGGMGHVFAAWDIVLNRQVALKTIHPEIASHPESQKRFHREVSLALKITHPNVCRTFDIGQGNSPPESGEGASSGASVPGVVFLTMEFLDGETLAAMLARDGPQSLPEALSIARQIAAGLAAAHELGIVHRDIKPANVMLVLPVAPNVAALTPAISAGLEVKLADRPRAVITDFGLAREQSIFTAGDHSSVTHSGIPLGTLAYMAPEQLQGHAVSTATDVYAFGLVLFEMVTGKRAFPSSNPLSDLKQRLNGPPPSPLAVIPDLPLAWCGVIEGCLSVDPAGRFQSVTDAMAVLDSGRAKPPIARPDDTPHFRLPPKSFVTHWSVRNTIVTLATIFLAAVSLFVGGLRLYHSRTDSKVAPGALIYLTQVKNQTGEKALDNLTELIQAGLAQSAQINLLDQDRVGDILQQMDKAPDIMIDGPIAREIALRTGAARVLFATVSGSGGRYHLQIEIQEPDAGSPNRFRNHRTKDFEWQSTGGVGSTAMIAPELSHAIRDSSNWIRREVGESANDIARLDVPPEDVTTRSWAALSDYSQAEQMARDNRLDGAAVALANAVREDEQFALAYGRLGDILLSLHRDMEGYRSYDKALVEAQQDRLTRKEEDRIRGMRAEDTEDYQLAIDAFRDMAVYYKNDYLGWVYPTVPLRMLGRDQEAIANLRRAIVLDPNQAFGPFALAQELMIIGNFEEVPHWISHLNQHGHPEVASEIQGILLLMDHSYDEAGSTLHSAMAATGQEQSSSNMRKQARLAAERGDYQSTLHLLDQGLATANSQSDREQRAAIFLDRAYVEYRLNDFRRSIDDVRSGFTLSSNPEILLSASDLLGNIFAVAPPTFAARIRETLEEIEKRVPPENYGTISVVLRLRTHGELLLTRGERRPAVELFRNASRKDAPASSRDYLGRALIALAASEHNQQAKRTLLTEAVGAFAVISERPALVWCNWLGFPPGFYADQLESYLKVSTALGISDSTISHASAELATLRPGSPVIRPFPTAQPATIPTTN